MIKVEIREYERGWGSRLDEVKEFDDYDSAVDFCRDFNKDNNLEYVPDWYMVAKIKEDR